MIPTVGIKNFKSLHDVQIQLERFTVFVGPNASGKSSILYALDCLCRAFRTQDQLVNQELVGATTCGSSSSVELLGKLANSQYHYRTRTMHQQYGVINPNNPWNGEGPGFCSTHQGNDWKPWGQDPKLLLELPLSVRLRLENSKLVQPTIANPNPSVMCPDGTGLHFALSSMTLSDPDSWQALQGSLRKIIPTINRLRFEKPTVYNQAAPLLFDTLGAIGLKADQVSEGTLLILGLLAALHTPDQPNLLLLDDIDRGLHPKAQKELVNYLRGVLATKPELQIIATTHSPYMLDWFEPDEVRMTILQENGSTICAPLKQHPEFQKWKDEMTPGEMWSIFGEKWLLPEVASV